jgi:hydrogenase nickel incorporation protein HypA/HybF
MHELALIAEIMDIAERARGGRRVLRIVLEIGKLSAVLPDAIRFGFEMVREDTALADTTLEIIEVPGLGRCRACGADVILERPFGRCVCSHTDLEWVAGTELRIKTMEVD